MRTIIWSLYIIHRFLSSDTLGIKEGHDDGGLVVDLTRLPGIKDTMTESPGVDLSNGCTLFVKKLPEECTATELCTALETLGPVTGVKLLKRRRAIIDCQPTDWSAVEALLASGIVMVNGRSCPILRPDNGGIQPGGSSEPDHRTLGTQVCPVCMLEFGTKRKLEAHLNDKFAHRPPPPAWQSSRLKEFDLSPHTMVAGLAPGDRAALDAYLAHAAPQWPELPAVVSHVAAKHPTSLRLKELFETLEFFRVVGQFLYERQRQGKLDSILDLACGHGLLGVLLAYRFPEVPVTCVDLEPRLSLAHYREAWVAEGQPAAGHSAVLDNLNFVRQDVATIPIGAGTAVVCVHACNEANLIILRRCREVGALAWAVMPCCVPEGLYGADCRRLPDEVRYPAMVGMMATEFGAAKLRAIDARLTNRNLICMGPRSSGSRTQRGGGDGELGGAGKEGDCGSMMFSGGPHGESSEEVQLHRTNRIQNQRLGLQCKFIDE